MTNYLQLARDANLVGVPKALYCALCSRADDNGLAYPSIEVMITDTGISRRSVQRGLRILLDNGWISKARSDTRNIKKQSNWLYTIAGNHSATQSQKGPKLVPHSRKVGATQSLLYKEEVPYEVPEEKSHNSSSTKLHMNSKKIHTISLGDSTEDIVGKFPAKASLETIRSVILKFDKDGVPTKGSLCKLYQRVYAHVTGTPINNQIPLSRAEQSFIKLLLKKTGKLAPDVIVSALANWSAYASWLDKNTTAFNIPKMPSAKFLGMYAEDSVMYAKQYTPAPELREKTGNPELRIDFDSF